ncbi:MAG: rod-binding protein [Pseudomonadota bacterium]
MTDPIGALITSATGEGARPKISADRDLMLKEKAKEFEAAFIAEMLKNSGLSDAVSTQSGFGGEAFSSFLVQSYADQLAEDGGFGLADKIYEQLRVKEVGDGE